MKSYLLQSSSNMLDETLLELLKKQNGHSEEITLPTNPEKISEVFSNKDGGIVFIPPIWDDLLCVKIIREICMLETPFETVIAGKPPSVSDLIVAFNDGLSAYLETPVKDGKLNLTISRATRRLKKKLENKSIVRRLIDYEGGNTPHYYSPQMAERDQLLAHAILDILKKRGPLVNGDVKVLLVSSSKIQQKRLEEFLRGIGISVSDASDIDSALKSSEKREFNLVVSDNLLPDGDALTLVSKLRKSLKARMPRFFVWSANPEKVSELLDPKNHIDDVIIKPGPTSGMESLLPSLLAGIYGTEG